MYKCTYQYIRLNPTMNVLEHHIKRLSLFELSKLDKVCQVCSSKACYAIIFAINFAPLMTHPFQRLNLFFRIFLEKEKTTFATFLENENMIGLFCNVSRLLPFYLSA